MAIRLALLPVILSGFSLPAKADPVQTNGTIIIDQPVARPTPPGSKVGAGYLRVTNTSSTPDRFLGGTTDRAQRIEVHEMTVTDNIMRMRALENGIEIKPGQTVELKPGGLHLMFVNLAAPFKNGDQFKASLVFEKAGNIEVEFKIGPVSAPAAGEHAH